MKISDAHTDFLTEIKDKTEREKYVRQISAVADTISCAIYTSNSTISVQDVENFKLEIEEYNKKYHTNLLLSIEDLGFVKNTTDLTRLIQLKPVSVTLTWNDKNQFAGGANSKCGLTKYGRKVVKLLEENNILIDTAHLSRRAFWDFQKITTKPIYNSHSNVNALFRHKRNLTTAQVKAVVKSNGYLGITLYEKFVSNNEISCRDVALQFNYLIKKFGCKNFGLGTDLFGIEKQFLPTDFKSYFDIKNLFNELNNLGYSNKEIKLILQNNLKNFLKKLNSHNSSYWL